MVRKRFGFPAVIAPVVFGSLIAGALSLAVVHESRASGGDPSVSIGQPETDSGSLVSVPVTLSNFDPGDYQAFVSVPEDTGTLSLGTTTGLTAIYGYDPPNFTRNNEHELGFQGELDDVENALFSVMFESATGNPSAEIDVSVTEAPSGPNAPNIYYNPDNGHYYEYVEAEADEDGNNWINWSDALANAGGLELFGMTGYLATITTQQESDFVFNQVRASNVWIGATDDKDYLNGILGLDFSEQSDAEGQWHWVTGPEAGTKFWVGDEDGECFPDDNCEFEKWADGEPNNNGEDEHYAAANYEAFGDRDNVWNDFKDDGNKKANLLAEFGGLGATSDAVTATSSRTIVSGAPTDLVVVPGETSFEASWSAPDTGADEVTAYEYSSDGGTSWSTTADVGRSATITPEDICDDTDLEVRALVGDQPSAHLTATVSGCNTITIVSSGGAAEGSGWVVDSGTISSWQDVSIDADDVEAELSRGALLIEAQRVVVEGAIAYSGGNSSLTLRADDRVQVQAGITSSSGALDLVLWSDHDDDDFGGVSIVDGASIDTNGGHVWAGGSSSDGGSGSWNGLTVGDGPSVGADGANVYSLDFQASLATDGGDVLIWTGEGQEPGLEGIAVQQFSSNYPSIDTGSGDLTLITAQLIDWETSNAALEVTTTGTLTLAPDGPDGNNQWSDTFAWDGSLSGGNFTLENIGGSGQPLQVNSLSSLGGLVIGDDLSTSYVQPSTAAFTVNQAVTINGPMSIFGSKIDIDAAMDTSSANGNIQLVATGGFDVVEGGEPTDGIGVAIGADIDAGTGSVTVSGTASSSHTGDGNHGVEIDSAAVTGGAGVSITGVGGGTGDSENNEGVTLRGATLGSGAGDITVSGERGVGSLRSEGISLEGSKNTLGSGDQTGDITLLADHFYFGVENDVLGSGVVSLEPLGAQESFEKSQNVRLLNLGANVSGLSVGKAGNEAGITLSDATDFTVAGPLTIYSDAVSLEADVTATTVTLEGAAADDLNGDLTITSGHSLTADALLVRNIHQAALDTGGTVTVDTFASEGGHRLLLTNSKSLSIGTVADVSGVDATEYVAITTASGDLTVDQQVSTSFTNESWALRLWAGRDTAHGTASGGDVIIDVPVEVGAIDVPNAPTHVYSGSAAASTGLSDIATAEAVATSPPSVDAGEVAVAYRAGPPTFQSSGTMRFGESLTLVATDPAGADVTFSKANTADPCTISGTTLTPSGVGDCVVEASGSLTATQTVTITQAPQTLSFTSSIPTSAVKGTTYTPAATSTSGLTPTLAITAGSPEVCELSGGVVTFNTSGTCTIQAAQPGDSNYLAASAITQTIVAGKINQNISFPAITEREFGDPNFAAGATVSSGREVTYGSETTSVCSVGSSTGIVSLLAVGDCTITASSAGNTSYAAAPDVTRTFSVEAVAPGKTTLTSISFGNTTLSVGFSAPGWTGGADITAYHAVISPTGGGSDLTQSCSTASPCVLTGLTNGSEYEVTLAAVNSAGRGPASDTSPATTPVNNPDAVSGLATAPGDEQLEVTWEPLFDFGGATFTRYEVSIRESGESTFGDTKTITVSSTNTTTFTGLTNGTGYDVKVVTITSANSTELESNSVFALGVPMTVPDAPTDVTLSALSSTSVYASWSAPVDDGGDSVDSFQVTPECTFDNPTDTFCTLTGLTPSSTVVVQVGATNLVGTGTLAQSSVTLPAAPNSGGSPGRERTQESVTPPLAPLTEPVVRGNNGRLPLTPQASGERRILPGPIQFPTASGGVAGNTQPRSFVGGIPAPVESLASGQGGVDLSVGSLRLGLRPVLPPAPGSVAPQGGPQLMAPAGSDQSLRGSGLLPGSQLQVFAPGLGGVELGRLSVDESGEFAGDVSLRMGPEGMPMPIGQHSLQMIGYDENGNQIVVEMPVSIAQPSPSPMANLASGEMPQLAFGEHSASSAGMPDSVTIVALPERGQVNAVAGEWEFSVQVSRDRGSVAQAGSSAEIRLIQQSSAEASGAGFQPGSRVDLWLFSEPTLLTSVTVNDLGQFTSEFFLDPRFATVGEHALQLQGVGTDGYVKAVNLGVAIDEPLQLTESGANLLLWWAVGVFALLVVGLVAFAALSKRRERLAG